MNDQARRKQLAGWIATGVLAAFLLPGLVFVSEIRGAKTDILAFLPVRQREVSVVRTTSDERGRNGTDRSLWQFGGRVVRLAFAAEI